jgi:hypothetical protein
LFEDGHSVHNRIHARANDAEGRQRLARYMIRGPFALEKMRYIVAAVMDEIPGPDIFTSQGQAIELSARSNLAFWADSQSGAKRERLVSGLRANLGG